MSLFRMTLLAFTVLVLAKSADCLAVATVTVNSGNVLRKDVPNEMDVSISISNADPTDLVGGDVQQTIFKRLAIFLPSYTDHTTTRLRYADEPASSTTTTTTTTTGTTTTASSTLSLEGFSISFRSAPEMVQNGQLVNVTLYLRITDNNSPAVFPDIFVTKQRNDVSYKVIPISVTYTGAQNSPVTVSYDVEMITAVANEDPSSLTVTPTHKSLEVAWDPKTSITYNDGVKRAPTGILVYAIDLTINQTMRFDGTVYNADRAQEENRPDSCTFEASDDMTTCSISCPSGQYMTQSEDTPPEGVKIIVQDASLDSLTIGDLDPEKDYAIFARYQPDSIGRTVECKIGRPVINYSLSEMNNLDLDAKQGDPACFVATAAYGSPMHKNLSYLRWFRDKYLLRSKAGKLFVKEYYKFGPGLAAVIAGEPLLRSITRGLLWPFVATIVLFKEATTSTLVFMAALLYMLTAIFIQRVSRPILAKMGVSRYRSLYSSRHKK